MGNYFFNVLYYAHVQNTCIIIAMHVATYMHSCKYICTSNSYTCMHDNVQLTIQLQIILSSLHIATFTVTGDTPCVLSYSDGASTRYLQASTNREDVITTPNMSVCGSLITQVQLLQDFLASISTYHTYVCICFSQH